MHLRRRVILPLLLWACCLSALSAAPPPTRIVSMAPSSTEILFALGLGEKVVGVTRYCDYPEAARAIKKVGGYVDPSYEAIVALKPDLVILLNSQADVKAQLEKLNVASLLVPYETLADIHEAIRLIGARCGASGNAQTLLHRLSAQEAVVREAVAGKPRPMVLICIGRDTDSGQLAGMFFAGRNGFYDEIIELAGGLNAYRDEAVAYPQLSAEGVMQLNPDCLLDLLSRLDPEAKSAAEISAQWAALRTVKAVRDKKIYLIAGDHALRPGPRYAQFLSELARLLHLEAFPEDGANE